MSLIRPLVARLEPYVPGEQPKIRGLVKLNTNENPYPPSPKVMAAVRGAVDERLRLYPNPTAQPLREKLARLHGCEPDNIIVGNGSDELLAIATRCFAEPASGGAAAGKDQGGKGEQAERAHDHAGRAQPVEGRSVHPAAGKVAAHAGQTGGEQADARSIPAHGQPQKEEAEHGVRDQMGEIGMHPGGGKQAPGLPL